MATSLMTRRGRAASCRASAELEDDAAGVAATPCLRVDLAGPSSGLPASARGHGAEQSCSQQDQARGFRYGRELELQLLSAGSNLQRAGPDQTKAASGPGAALAI